MYMHYHALQHTLVYAVVHDAVLHGLVFFHLRGAPRRWKNTNAMQHSILLAVIAYMIWWYTRTRVPPYPCSIAAVPYGTAADLLSVVEHSCMNAAS